VTPPHSPAPFDLTGPLPTAPPCCRRAQAPARRSPSPDSWRATSPRARRGWTSCSSSASAASRPASCAAASASDWSAPATAWPPLPPATSCCSTSPTATRPSGCCGTGGCATRSRPSTRRPSRRRTASASRCCSRSARPATTTPTRCSSRTCPTWWPRSRTTSTCASGARPARPRRSCPWATSAPSPRRSPCATPPPARPGPVDARAAGAARTDRDPGAPGDRAAQAPAVAARLRRHAHARPGDAARPGHRPGRRRAAARALRQGPRRRVPGHRPGAVVDPGDGLLTAPGRSCSSATRSRPSTPSAARTSTPTCRRRRSPAPSRRCPTTGAATPSCCAGSTRCSAAPRWATRASGCSRSGPPVPDGCSARRAPSGCASSVATTCRRRRRAWR
jgi:hypothetical protein